MDAVEMRAVHDVEPPDTPQSQTAARPALCARDSKERANAVVRGEGPPATKYSE
jgi:hypothetical protein